jgi:hypothetical protein
MGQDITGRKYVKNKVRAAQQIIRAYDTIQKGVTLQAVDRAVEAVHRAQLVWDQHKQGNSGDEE